MMELYLMADRWYSIKKQLEPLGVTPNIPSFLAWKGQLSQKEVTESQTAAAAGIQRIKYFWQIRNEIPLAMHGSINQFVIFSHYIYSYFFNKFLQIMYLTYIVENLFLPKVCYICQICCPPQTPICWAKDQNSFSWVPKLVSSHDILMRLFFF